MKMFNEAGQAVYFNRVMKNGRGIGARAEIFG